MGMIFRWLSLALVGFVMAFQFNNCGHYAEPVTYSSSQSSASCTEDDCIPATLDNLTLKVNYGGSVEYSVPADLSEFNLGGDCNESGFPFNTVRWELYLNNTMVRHSGLLQADSRCINGRFMIYVNLTSVSADPVDRTGLKTSTGGRAAYDLWVEIYGQSTQGGTPQRNLLKGRTRMLLTAI